MTVPAAAFRGSAARTDAPTVGICWDRPTLGGLAHQVVSYQAAQFLHLDAHASVVSWGPDMHAHARALAAAPGPNAILTFDEWVLWQNPTLAGVEWGPETSFVWVAHDTWSRPLTLIEILRRQRNPLLVLRHRSAVDLYARLAPDLPSVLQRPGVEVSIFHPQGPKQWDVLISGSETPDYPHRIRFNRIVREWAPRLGWRMLDLTATGLLNNPRSNQLEYAPALAAAKVSVTASVHGGRAGATIVTQFLDHSPARAQVDRDAFVSLDTPELAVEHVGTGGITPRYLESLASGTLLLADLPPHDAQEWYRDKMVVVDETQSDEEIAETIDWWVRHDAEREALCDHALRETLATETSEARAAELADIVADHLAR